MCLSRINSFNRTNPRLDSNRTWYVGTVHARLITQTETGDDFTMEEINEEEEFALNLNPPINEAAAQQEAAIVSGSEANMESDDDEQLAEYSNTSSSSSDDDGDDGGGEYAKMKTDADAGDLYNENMDDEDEAWVYKHLRSGQEEYVAVRRQVSTSATTAAADVACGTDNPLPLVSEQIKVLKPRYSDAILSCPCCFTTVCMDCQQHVQYKNQYRAMFVMNIEVHWDTLYSYDDDQQQLVPKQAHPPGQKRSEMSSPQDPSNEQSQRIQQDNNDESKDVYYSVHCIQCKTQVAALCMHDQIYHFFDCVATAA